MAQTKPKTAQTNKHSDHQGSPLLPLQKLTCGTCGAKMTTTFTTQKKGEVLGFTCSTKHKKGNSVCDCKDISALTIERLVIDLVRQIGSSEKLFDSVFEQFLQNDGSEQKLREEKLIELLKNLLEIKAESKKLIVMVAKNKETEDYESVKEALEDFNQR